MQTIACYSRLSNVTVGRFYELANSSAEPVNKNVPLETFTISRGLRYRFRLISAAMTFVFRVSVDHHTLHVIATDGSDVREQEVESVLVSGGERFDFWIQADDPTGEGLYWIRVETLEEYHGGQVRLLNGGVRVIVDRSTSYDLGYPSFLSGSQVSA